MASGLLVEWSIHLGAVAAIVTAVGIIFQRVLKPMWQTLHEGAILVRRVIVAADRILPFAEQQLKPNGGSSLTDKINQIEPNHRAAEDHWKRLEDGQQALADLVELRHAEVTNRLDVIEKKVV